MRIVGRQDSKSRLLLQDKVDQIELLNGNYACCWGSNVSVEYDVVINNVRRKNAIEQLTAFMDNNVPTISYTTDLLVAKSWHREGALVFGRMINHSQGTDIVGPRHRDWKHREWWSKVVPDVAEEWRIHVFNGRSIARGLKAQTGSVWRKMPVRNRNNGWTMVHSVEPSEELREVAKKAVAACGYMFGAVDLIKDTSGNIFTLEVNLAAGLDNYTANAYTEAIRKYVKRTLRESEES